MTTHQNEIKKEKVNTLNELIQATRDSAEFYLDASKAVDNATLRTLFVHMADSKNGLIGAMSKQVRVDGGVPAKAGTLLGPIREMYGDVRAKLSDDKNYTYVSELEKGEDRLMNAFHDVIKSDDASTEVKAILRSYLPTVQEQHDLLRNRKWDMEAKH
jgi:uncharacterized protein (TIGR02284 family)